MKTILIISFLILVLSITSYAQRVSMVDLWTRHGKQLSQSYEMTSDKIDSVIVQFAGSVNKEVSIDTLVTGAAISTVWSDKGDIMWNGYLRIQISIANIDLATDSLQVSVYALDKDGNVISNDYVYCEFAVPPSWDDTVVTLDWTSAVNYVADLSGAFGEGVGGILICPDLNDETGSHLGVGTLKVTTR